MKVLQDFIYNFKHSPYGAVYSLKWIWLRHFPSIQKYYPVHKINSFQVLHEMKSKFKLVFCGDLMNQLNNEIPSFDSKISDVFLNADKIIINSEFPLLEENFVHLNPYRGRYKISEKFLIGVLESAKIDNKKLILLLSNNHMNDYGIAGIQESLNRLDKLGIEYAGILFGEDSDFIKSISINGCVLGIMPWTNLQNNPRKMKFPCVTTEEDIFNKKINSYENHYDCLIGLPHWDYEYQLFPHKETRSLAEQLIKKFDYAAIVGCHSHIIQLAEMIDRVPVFFSLGNFVNTNSFGLNWKNSHWLSRLGAILTLDFGCSDNDKVKLCGYKLDFIFHDLGKNSIMHIDNITGDSKRKVFQHLGLLFNDYSERISF